MNFKRSFLTQSVKCALAMSLLTLPLLTFAKTSEEADLNSDGQVNFRDLYEIIKRNGAERGTAAYRAELDIDNNGTIQIQDYFLLFANYAQISDTGVPTRFMGQVTDNQSPPNPIMGVRVELENTGIDACTDQFGRFSMMLSPADFGENKVTFDGNGGELANNLPCVTVDATPGTLSGEYPVVPHKPVFINGNIDNEFRRMSLPERNLTGSALVDSGNANATGNDNEFELITPLTAGNDGANLAFESGCMIQFPAGENPRISITQVDAAQLPVAPPPGQGSSLFVTFQPGGSSIGTGLNGGCDFVEVLFENTDMMANASGFSGPDQPGLRGVFDGAFQEIIKVFAGDFDNDVFVNAPVGDETAPWLRGEIPVPFDFAWYAVTVPVAPCPTTTVIGQVLLNNVPMDPVENAKVTMGGIGPVQTMPNGTFSIPNVPAGPNGIRCTSNPFLLSAAASKDLDTNGQLSFGEIGGSGSIPAVSGGITDLGIIKLGLTGVVQGEVMKLSRIEPWLTIPLPFTQMTLNPVDGPDIVGETDDFGNFRLENIPLVQFRLHAEFDGVLPLPGGGEAPKHFEGFTDNQLGFAGQILPLDFNFMGFADSVTVNVFEPGILPPQPLPFLDVQLFAFGFSQNGFSAPSQSCFGQTDQNGQVVFSANSPNNECFGQNIPMGPCEVYINDFNGGEFFNSQVVIREEDGCFINEHGQMLVLDAEFTPPVFPGDITQVQINQGVADPGNAPIVDVLVLRVTFTEPFLEGSSFSSFAGVFGELDLDMDQNQDTGYNSQFFLSANNNGGITANNVISENVGADVRVICGDNILFFGGGFGLDTFECVVVDQFGLPIPGMENPELTTIGGGPFESGGDMVLLIPKQPLIDFANTMPNGPFGNSLWDVALEIGVAIDGYGGYGGYGGVIFDIAPNVNFGADPFEVDPNNSNTLDDPIGDFFSEEFFVDQF